MCEMRGGFWALIRDRDRASYRRGMMAYIIEQEKGDTRAATAWAHNAFGITDGNSNNKNRYPLKKLWFELKKLLPENGDNVFKWNNRKVVAHYSPHNDTYIVAFDIETIEGTLRLRHTSYDAGAQWFWDREPTVMEKGELAFFLISHHRPVFAIWKRPD